MNRWYKLDNAAKIFPSVTSTKNSSVYRMSAVLTEEIDPQILQKAVDCLYDRYPTMFVRLRRGVFWNYLDENINRFYVTEEKDYPCGDINPRNNNGFMIKVLYYKCKISIEVFHSLADGGGAIEFLKSILFYYLQFSGKDVDDEGKVILANPPASQADVEDAFLHYYNHNAQKTEVQKQAYRIKGNLFQSYGVNVISGTTDAKKLNAAAKSHNTTITGYVTSALIYSIYQSRQKFENNNHPIVVTVPVSLRKTFPSRTLRNFFVTANVGTVVTPSSTFEDVVNSITEELKKQTQKEYLDGLIANNVKIEKNFAAKVVPLFIKNIFMPLGFNFFGEIKKTITVSNLGNIVLPESVKSFVKKTEVILYPTQKSPINCGLCSTNNVLSITFARTIEEKDIIRYFFSFLAENDNLDITVSTNDWGRNDDL